MINQPRGVRYWIYNDIVRPWIRVEGTGPSPISTALRTRCPALILHVYAVRRLNFWSGRVCALKRAGEPPSLFTCFKLHADKNRTSVFFEVTKYECEFGQFCFRLRKVKFITLRCDGPRTEVHLTAKVLTHYVRKRRLISVFRSQTVVLTWID